MNRIADERLDDLELAAVAAAIDEAGFNVGALRIRQAQARIAELEAQVDALTAEQDALFRLNSLNRSAADHCLTRAEAAEATLERIQPLPDVWRECCRDGGSDYWLSVKAYAAQLEAALKPQEKTP